ncbi:hypothetical protein [Actinoplanes friuliensis]|jgi:hypothetical protein|uniref:Uncharacterized protein n=1 Tax=Actinoplanes friuliensis DSM 7358 TaxID=1246995 RepID=U5WBG9_9ACTN|nr:hypothetical protein [Actinoplanes friuliensis]AGZ46337.1 hypothetical protein AFR_40415 [Actinoplanes friuliensis DSM 7358]
MADEWRAAWITALDELEADVDAVERMITQEHRNQELAEATPWAPPEGIGPIPLDLRPRADYILTRQLEVAQAAAIAMTANRRQTAFAARVEVGTAGKGIPTYIDCAM